METLPPSLEPVQETGGNLSLSIEEIRKLLLALAFECNYYK